MRAQECPLVVAFDAPRDSRAPSRCTPGTRHPISQRTKSAPDSGLSGLQLVSVPFEPRDHRSHLWTGDPPKVSSRRECGQPAAVLHGRPLSALGERQSSEPARRWESWAKGRRHVRSDSELAPTNLQSIKSVVMICSFFMTGEIRIIGAGSLRSIKVVTSMPSLRCIGAARFKFSVERGLRDSR